MNERAIFIRCAWRLLPLTVVAFIVNFLDRTNVGFAALTMNRDLAFSPSVYGFGAGIFFASYSLFQVPSNLALHRFGARRWLCIILAAWGIAAAANALIRGPSSYYTLRFLVGMAEAGFFPGIILYLTYWFPKAWLGRFTAIFMAGNVASFIVGGPLASFILSLDGVFGLSGWQWLFVLEGLPACFVAVAVLKLLPDGPEQAPWLDSDERAYITGRVASELGAKEQDLLRALLDPRVIALGVAYGGILFAIYGFGFWLPLLIQGSGFSNRATGFVTASLYVAAVPAMIIWGRSSDRNDERIWHTAGGALVGAAALLFASSARGDLLLLAIAVSGAAIYAILAPFYGVASSFMAGRAMAGAFALINMVGGLLGGFLGQYVIGVIRERTGGYSAALAVMAVALLLSALIVLALGRRLARPHTVASRVEESG